MAAPLPGLSLPWCPTGTGFIQGLRVKAPCTEAASYHKHQWGSLWGHRRTRQEYPKFNASLGLVSKITKNKQPPQSINRNSTKQNLTQSTFGGLSLVTCYIAQACLGPDAILLGSQVYQARFSRLILPFLGCHCLNMPLYTTAFSVLGIKLRTLCVLVTKPHSLCVCVNRAQISWS